MRLSSLLALFAFTQMGVAQTFYVRFPDDQLLHSICPFDTVTLGSPTFFNPEGLPLIATYQDENFLPILSDACTQFERQWQVIDTARYAPGQPCIYVPNPMPLPMPFEAPLNLAGPVVSPISQPGDPWSATEVNIHPNDPAPTNFSAFWNDTATCYLYKQLLRIRDTLPPVVDCPTFTFALPDSTANDSLFWNDAAWTGISPDGPDLPEALLEGLSVTASDACTGESVAASYLLFLDLDQDDSVETVVRPGEGYAPAGMVRFGNAGNPNYGGGELRPFDQRPVAANKKFYFDVDRTLANGQATMSIIWRTPYSPFGIEYAPAQLPPGHHAIRWTVEDACGNSLVCEVPFSVTALVTSTSEGAPSGFPGGLRVWPNPGREAVHFGFQMTQGESVRSRICDANGHLCYEKACFFPAGEQVMSLERAAFCQAGGIFYYTLSSGNFCQSGKLAMLP